MAFLDNSGVTRLWQHIIAKLGNKVDKETGKGLSTNDYTTTEKDKLAGIEDGANNYTLPVASSTLGGVRTTNTDELDLLTANGYAPIPIVDGIPYFMPVSVLENDGFHYLTVGNLDLKIYNKGILSLSQGTTNGTIKYTWFNQQVNNTVTSDLKIKGLDTAAYHPESYFVPATRTINNKALSANISLTASDVGAAASSHTHSYLPLTGGTLTGSLTVNDNIYGKGNLVSQTNSYPGLTIQNASGANLAMLYSDGANGGYSNIGLRVYSSASAYSSFSFRKDGQFMAPNDIIAYGGVLKSSKNSVPSIALTNASGEWLAYLAAETTDGSYGNAKLRVNKSAAEGVTFTFGNNGNINVPGTVNLGNALSISSGGTGATSAASALANLGAASSTLVRGQMKTFTIAGDKDHYYPVVFNVNSEYFVNRIAITRYYNDTAPDDWGTDTNHKGGLTFQFQWNGDMSWGGNGTSTSLKVETLIETYCKMVGGIKLSTSGVVVWLRGGSALYKVLNEMGSAMSIAPYYDTFTDAEGKSFPVRTYDASVVDNEIQQRLVFYPLTGGNLLGNLYASGEICSKTNNYPEVSFKNAAGTTLADFYVNTTSGGYGDTVLKVSSDASTAKYFVFGTSGVFGIPNGFSAPMGELKSNAWPQLFFRNKNGNNLAQLVVPTDNGSYSGLAVNIFSDASNRVEYTFNSNGTFIAPFAVQAMRTYVKTNNYPELLFQNANGVTLAELYANTTTGAYAPIVLRVKQSVNDFSEFTFGNDGKLSCGSLALATALPISSGGTGATTASGALTNLGALPLTGGTLTGNLGVNGIITAKTYLAVERNSNPQLALKNANSNPLAVLYAETSNGSYGNTHLQVYKSATESTTFIFSNQGSFRATMLQVDGSNDWPSLYFKCSSKTNPGVLLQASSNHSFGIYCYGSDLDNASTRYFEGYTFPAPATGLTANKTYTVYSEKNIIYSSSQPTGVKGAIWLKPV